MVILEALVVVGLLQLVAVPTITTPLPQDRDEFADQLKALGDAVKKLPAEELQLAYDDDLIKSLTALEDNIETNQASSLERVDQAVAEAIDQFKEIEDDDGADDHMDDLLDEVSDDLEDELNNLKEISKVLPTDAPDELDELVDNVMTLVDSNETVYENGNPTIDNTDKTPIGDSSNIALSIAEDDLVNDLMDLKIAEEIVSEIITELVPDTEPVVTEADVNGGWSDNPATSLAPDDDIDYELATELTMFTEVVYELVPDELSSVSDDVELSSPAAAVTLIDDLQPTMANTSPQQNGAVLSKDSTTIQRSENHPESTMVVTEVITELETEIDLVVTELNGFFTDRDGDDTDDISEKTPTDLDNEDLEMELWNLKAATDEMGNNDDEPTFVFTTPYPSTLGSTEGFNLGPDLKIGTVQSGFSCPKGRYMCADGSQCVLQDTVCDIMFDCADGSDESPNVCQLDRECPSGFTKCSRSPQCIENKDWCDGVYHCYNGADEKKCMSCVGPNGDMKNLLIEDFCDGVQDCDDNYDETSERCNHPCPLGFSKCADGLQCIKDHLFCNGFKNCRDGSDENHDCARSMEECENFEMFACDGICMITSALCDGMPDCRDGVDERGCSDDIFSCPDGFIRRKEDHVCVHRSISSKGP